MLAIFSVRHFAGEFWGCVLRAIGLCSVLFLYWLLLSGHYTFFLVSLGVLSSIGVMALSKSMKIMDREGQPFHLIFRAIGYWAWLMLEIIKSGTNVAKLILDPSLPITPALQKVKTTQKSALGRNIFANSITLTPGTISVELEGRDILVHAITSEGIEDLQEGVMDRRVSKFEGAD